MAAAGHAASAVQWCESLALSLGTACCCAPQFDCVADPVHICHLPAAARHTETTGEATCLVISDLDAGAGNFKDTQRTVNTQNLQGERSVQATALAWVELLGTPKSRGKLGTRGRMRQ